MTNKYAVINTADTDEEWVYIKRHATKENAEQHLRLAYDPMCPEQYKVYELVEVPQDPIYVLDVRVMEDVFDKSQMLETNHAWSVWSSESLAIKAMIKLTTELMSLPRIMSKVQQVTITTKYKSCGFFGSAEHINRLIDIRVNKVLPDHDKYQKWQKRMTS